MNEPNYTSKDPNEGCELVICNACEHLQHERTHPLDMGGKYAWRCEQCGIVNDGDRVHLLQNTARFNSKYGI